MLTPRQAELLSFLTRYSAKHGVMPSYDEIAEALNLRSKSGVHRMVECLIDRGYLRRMPKRARALEIIRHPSHLRCPHCGEGIHLETLAIPHGQSARDGLSALRPGASVAGINSTVSP